jgi:hypothetical protein
MTNACVRAAPDRAELAVADTVLSTLRRQAICSWLHPRCTGLCVVASSSIVRPYAVGGETERIALYCDPTVEAASLCLRLRLQSCV